MATERIEPGYDGLNTDSAPDTLKTEAPVLENFLVDRPGKLPLRGPINGAVQIYAGAVAEKPIGHWVFNNAVLIGLKANDATATRDPWVAPFRRAATEAELGEGHTSAYHLDLETGATSAVAVTVDTTPGPRFSRLGDYVWGVGYSRSPGQSFSANGGVHWKTALLRWDGTTNPPVAFTAGPLGAQDVRVHLNRLWAAGGLKPGTTTYSPNSLWWTDLGGPTADTLAQWQDDVSGLVNEFVVDSNDPSDFIVGLAKVGRMLAIFKRRSIHLLIGDTSATWVIRPFTQEIGCIDPRSILEYQDGVFFCSDQGLIWFDGSQLINVTQDQRSVVVAGLATTVGNLGVDGGRAVVGRLPNDYIFLGIGTSPADTNPSTMAFTGIYHPPRTAWSELTSDALSGGRPIAAGRALSKTFLVDDQKVVGADAITAPESVEASSRGYDTGSSLLTFPDISTGGGALIFDGAGGTARNPDTLVEAWTSQVNFPIAARWRSKLARLAQSMYASVVKRLSVDYTFQTAVGDDDDALGWKLSLVDGRGNTLMAPTQVPSQGASTTYRYRRQAMFDINAEADDAQLVVEYDGAIEGISDAAIFNSYIEFEPTYQRPSR